MLINKMPDINRHKLNIVRGLIILGLATNITYLNLLFRYDKMNTCINDMLSTTTIFNKWILIIHFILLFRICIFSLINNSNEIEWEYNLFIFNTSNKFNMVLSYKILQIVHGFIGFFSILTFTHLYYNDDACIQDRNLINFVSIGFIPFIILGIEIYIKAIVCIVILSGMMFLPKSVFQQIDNYLARSIDISVQSNYPKKLYYGDYPQCCICYDIECNIIECGHLLCYECHQKCSTRKCPLCKSEINIVETYNDYKERRDTIINNIINNLINI